MYEWDLFFLRTAPNIPALLFLNDFDWKILFAKFNPSRKIPEYNPAMKQIIIWIAQPGGFLARKGNGEPSVTHKFGKDLKIGEYN